MASSNSRKSDLLRRSSSAAASTSTRPQSVSAVAGENADRGNSGSMTVDSILRDAYESGPPTESTLLDAQITLMETPANAAPAATSTDGNDGGGSLNASKTMDDVWKDMISGERKECKEEALDEMMTLEDFLAKAGAVDDDDDVKIPVAPTERMSGGVFTFDSINATTFQSLDKVEGSVVGFGNGVEMDGGGGERNKRARLVLEPLDKAALQRQRRMIKNRESAARSRERKQAYQVELESIAVRLEEENERLMREKAERTKKRYKQLMERVVPIVDKQKQPRVLRRVRSWQW
ncbi:G-box-binding factor 4-like [Neltuma alba]|uniref:G-box-binding factor 4-like n=1 Tax=Neltuma alba TaxID=207710 RepID=UPI0010A38F79|nr:G-box-binding factor 4-like [Prosopis alba]